MCPYPRKLNVKPYLSELIYNKSNHAILIHVDNIKRMTIPYPGTSIHIYAWSLHLHSSISTNIDSYICLTIPFLMSQVHSRDIAFNLMIFAHKSFKASRKKNNKLRIVTYTLRHVPPHLKLKKMIESWELLRTIEFLNFPHILEAIFFKILHMQITRNSISRYLQIQVFEM